MAVREAALSAVLWALSTLVFTLFGMITWRIAEVRAMSLPSRLAIAFMAGNVIGPAILYLESLLGLQWNVWTIGIPALAAVTWSAGVLARASSDPKEKARVRTPALHLLAVIALCFYGAFTARMTCGDLLYFWGPKAQAFYLARGIDFAFLGNPHYYFMHADYPPLQPIIFAVTSLTARFFSYPGAVLLTPLYLLATALSFSGLSRESGRFSVLLAAVLLLGFSSGRAAGGADPLLLLFEVTAISAVTFRPTRDGDVIAAIALAGAAFTKVEGAAFAIVVTLFAFVARRSMRPLLIGIPAAILLGSWVVVTRARGLVDSYLAPGRVLHFDELGEVISVTVSTASYSAAWLPWIAALAPLAFARSPRRAALPLAVGGTVIAYTLFFYLHEPDPAMWIRSSAERVLLTAVASFVVATAAASEYSPRDGLVPEGKETEGSR